MIRTMTRSRSSWRWKQSRWVSFWQKIWDRQWLLGSTAGRNRYHKLKLLGAWEPPGSSSSRRPSEFEETHNFVPYGN